jgi:hypothetical protein
MGPGAILAPLREGDSVATATKVTLSKSDEQVTGQNMYVPFPKGDAKTIAKYKPGDKVEITVIGDITGIEIRKPWDKEHEPGYVGEVRLSVTSSKIKKHSGNTAQELFDDEY